MIILSYLLSFEPPSHNNQVTALFKNYVWLQIIITYKVRTIGNFQFDKDNKHEKTHLQKYLIF